MSNPKKLDLTINDGAVILEGEIVADVYAETKEVTFDHAPSPEVKAKVLSLLPGYTINVEEGSAMPDTPPPAKKTLTRRVNPKHNPRLQPKADVKPKYPRKVPTSIKDEHYAKWLHENDWGKFCEIYEVEEGTDKKDFVGVPMTEEIKTIVDGKVIVKTVDHRYPAKRTTCLTRKAAY